VPSTSADPAPGRRAKPAAAEVVLGDLPEASGGERRAPGAPNVELRHLRAFAVTAEELHFTRAAARLHLRQQGLSAQIRHLERELGVNLFHRTTRSVTLTEAGEALRQHAVQILRALDAAVVDVRQSAAVAREVVTVCYTPTVSGDVLSAFLEKAHATLAHIRIGTCETWTPDTVSGVVEGRFDVAIARCPPFAREISSIEIRREPLGVVLAEAHPLAAHEVIPREALAGMSLVIWERRISPTVFDAVMAAFPEHTDPARHYEMEQFGPETFYGDPVSRREVLGGRAFYVTTEGHYEVLPTGFVWREVSPRAPVGCVLSYRADDQRAAVRDVVRAAQQVAIERGWLGADGVPV